MSDKKSKARKGRHGRNVLTFYEKIAVIRHHDVNHMSRNGLARIFQCCTTQIRQILEKKDELLTQWQAMSETDASAIVDEMTKKRREFELKAVGFILHQWVERCRNLQLNMVINNDTLKIVAIKMATVLNLSDFRPNARWIERFRFKFNYKEDDLAKPRSAEDPQGTLSVEDIIIEYKHYLPSFMQQDISNITLNNLRVSGIPVQGSSDPQTSEGEEFFVEGCTNQISPENVIQHLSVVKQFALINADHRAMALATELEHYVRKSYALSGRHTEKSTDDGDDVILVE